MTANDSEMCERLTHSTVPQGGTFLFSHTDRIYHPVGHISSIYKSDDGMAHPEGHKLRHLVESYNLGYIICILN